MMFMGLQNSGQAALENKVIILCVSVGMTKQQATDAIADWTKDHQAVSLSAHAWADRLINQWQRNQ